MSQSYDAAIKVDNYIRRFINPKRTQAKLNYRNQKGHKNEFDPNDIKVKFVFGNTPPTAEDNTNCEELQDFDNIEKYIIDNLLYDKDKDGNDLYNIQTLVRNWFSQNQ